MPFSIRPHRRIPVHCAVMLKASPSFKLPLACFLGFWSMITLLVLNSDPVYAEWVAVGSNDEPGMTVYLDPDTIRREGDLVTVWELLDYKTAQTQKGLSHLSIKVQFKYDCANERHRLLAFSQYAGNMGRGKVMLSNSDEVKWAPVAPDTLNHSLWTVACSKGVIEPPQAPFDVDKVTP
jgi:hypothetical protein